MEYKNVDGPIYNRRSNGRTEIGYSIVDGVECVVKYRPLEELQREARGWLALTLNGYKTTDFFSLALNEGRACAVTPAIKLPLIYDLCMTGSPNGIAHCLRATGAQFHAALDSEIEGEVQRNANEAYFFQRKNRLINAANTIRQRDQQLMNEKLVVNGYASNSIGDFIDRALDSTNELRELPFEQLTVTHGDPGDLNIFSNGTMIDYEVAGANDPISELATALHWQIFHGPTFAPRYHTSAYPSYSIGNLRKSIATSRDSDGFQIKQPLSHRITAAKEILKWYGPDSIISKKKLLRNVFAERFNAYWTYRTLTVFDVNNFSQQDLEAACCCIGLFSTAAHEENPQEAMESACESLRV